MLPLGWKYTKAVLEARARAAIGGLRERIAFDLEGRPPYSWGVLTAVDVARFVGIKRLAVAEFGVASGTGLLELCRISALISEETGIGIDVFGFDTGAGLTGSQGYRDHIELWAEGDFPMGNPEALKARLPATARLILGDIADTVDPFVRTLTSEAPLGFCVFDTDLWSSTVSSLRVYDGPADVYLPVGTAYFDDTLGATANLGALFRSAKAGQLLAIDEFNAQRPNRAIDPVRVLSRRRPLSQEQWIDQVYGVHVLNHPFRNHEARSASPQMLVPSEKSDRFWPM